jgi:hypothetical protein
MTVAPRGPAMKLASKQGLARSAPDRSDGIRQALAAFALCIAGSAAAPDSWAAPSRDELLREALLRGYTTQEAERRYVATRRENAGVVAPAQAGGVGAALGNLGGALAGMAARNQERADAERGLYNAMNAAVEKRQNYPLDTVLDAQTMKRVLEKRAADGDKWAQRQLIEYMLHQRPYAKFFFDQPDYTAAAALLRPFAYGGTQREVWALLTLAKLYIAGKGVPQDEGEAIGLVQSCATPNNTPRGPDAADILSCRVLLVNMHRNGWGFAADEKAAEAAMVLVRRAHDANFKPQLTDEDLMRVFR